MITRRANALVLETSPWLASAASAELASRERHYPAMVKAGTIERGDALVDLEAWRTIRRLFCEEDAGDPVPWAQLELATSRALISQSAKAEVAPGDRRAVDRREAVQALHDRIAWHRWYWTDPTATAPAFPVAPLDAAA